MKQVAKLKTIINEREKKRSREKREKERARRREGKIAKFLEVASKVLLSSFRSQEEGLPTFSKDKGQVSCDPETNPKVYYTCIIICFITFFYPFFGMFYFIKLIYIT